MAELQPHFEDLEILSLLGSAGMGSVYRVRSRDLGRTAAMKIMAMNRIDNTPNVERFLREAQALAQLSHPNIVGVYQFGRTDAFAYLLMEYVGGGSLRDRIVKGPLAPAETFSLIRQICDALQYAHDRGVIHRDIKPENILLDDTGTVKVADFGLAKVTSADPFPLTEPGSRMGTARYMAPEQWTNADRVDHRADLYSLGVMIYELLTGDLPGPQCKPPSEKVGTDPRLDKVVSKTLQEQPAERYQQAADIKTDVVRISSTSPLPKRIVIGAACDPGGECRGSNELVASKTGCSQTGCSQIGCGQTEYGVVDSGTRNKSG